jgi:hypothetical protein
MTISWCTHTARNTKGKISWKCFYASVISLAPSTHVPKCASNKIETEISKVLSILSSLSWHLQTESRMYIQHLLEIQRGTSLKFFFRHASIIM